jgi:hypothetical protein
MASTVSRDLPTLAAKSAGVPGMAINNRASSSSAIILKSCGMILEPVNMILSVI